jgi:hypothetical protein
MALVRALLAPTASGDGAGEPFCAPLPPSPHFSEMSDMEVQGFDFIKGSTFFHETSLKFHEISTISFHMLW